MHWNVLSVSPVNESGTRVPPSPHCGLLYVMSPVAVPPIFSTVNVKVVS